MSQFLGHIPCPNCGSKDNLGDYDDHQYCFGCKYYKLKDDIGSLRAKFCKRYNNDTDKGVEMIGNFAEIPRNAMKWLLSYGISQEDINEYKIKWDAKKQLLVLLDTAKYWQGRVFDPDSKMKYMSSGEKPLTIYGTGDKLVLVEDILSAIRIARTKDHYCGCPLLGSSLSYAFENEIIRRGFKQVLVWLDRDKAVNALRIKRKLTSRGIDSRVIVTDKDPKEYTKGEVLEWLKSKS